MKIRTLVLCGVALAAGCFGSSGDNGDEGGGAGDLAVGGSGATGGSGTAGKGGSGTAGTNAVGGSGGGGTGAAGSAGSGGGTGGPSSSYDCSTCASACMFADGPCWMKAEACNCGGGGGAGGAAGTGGFGSDCECPEAAPAAGDACEPCNGLPNCTYNDCAGTGRTVATCEGTEWAVFTEPCAATKCDDLECGDQVCVTIQGQAAGYRRCADDPCTPSALTCECAASICDGEFGATACRITGPNAMSCYATSSGCTPDGICPP